MSSFQVNKKSEDVYIIEFREQKIMRTKKDFGIFLDSLLAHYSDLILPSKENRSWE